MLTVAVVGSNEDGAGGGRAARGGALAVGMKQLMASERRHHDRGRKARAEDAHAGVDRRDVVEDARTQPQTPPRRDVVGDRDLVVGAGSGEREGARASSFSRALPSSASKSALSNCLSADGATVTPGRLCRASTSSACGQVGYQARRGVARGTICARPLERGGASLSTTPSPSDAGSGQGPAGRSCRRGTASCPGRGCLPCR